MSQQPARRSGGIVPLIAVIAIALVLWALFARPAAPASQPAEPTAAATEPIVAAESAPAAVEDAGTTATEQVAETAATALALEEPAAAPAPAATATVTPKPAKATATPTRGPPATYRGFPVITYAELPPEALDTLDLIDNDGPFPYSKDGSTFQNREQLLPRKPNSYYREYTVITPGEGDRGARRIVGGDEGERYYTDDHYASFYWIWIP